MSTSVHEEEPDVPLADLPDVVPLALAGTSFALGARHGLDRDHIAAITDLTSPRPDDQDRPRQHARRGTGLAFWYCTGHGLVLAVLGGLVLALGIGLRHGTGAETPTQVVLFASAGASGSAAEAVLILGAFVAGLVLTDLAIAGAWVSGLLGARRAPRVQITLGLVTGVASLVLRAPILTGYSGIVPPLVES